jgi:uncharacterized protein YfaS (alpha-2-macroglobulin family)
LVDAVLDAGKGKVTMNLNGKKYTYNFLRVSKHPTPFPPEDGSVEEEKFEDIGEIKPEETQVPKVDLKPFPKGLKYEFLGPDKTYPVIVSNELSTEENEKLLILLKKHRKVI